MKRIKIVSFTRNGSALAQTVKAALPDMLVEVYARGQDSSLKHTALSRFTQQAMVDTEGILFISSAGIAVRSIAPYLQNKLHDPAVWVMDEHGKFLIPILSGHIGGANAFAKLLADRIGATPVLTTATDINGVFQVDTWAKAQGLEIENTSYIQHISASLLAGETVGLFSEIPITGMFPQGILQHKICAHNIWISPQACPVKLQGGALHLVPKQLVLGIGCRRGKTEQEIAEVVQSVLQENGIALSAVKKIVSIDIKQDENGLLQFAHENHLPIQFYSEETLRGVAGIFASSAFVAYTVGVDNVCERAAAANGGKIICQKTAMDGVTVAIAKEYLEVMF